jgi:hypothetical protein
MKRLAYLVVSSVFIAALYTCVANVLDRERLSGILLSHSAFSIEGFGCLLALIMRLYLILVVPVLFAVSITLVFVNRSLRKRMRSTPKPQ